MRPAKILIIDDEDDLRALLAITLGKDGHEVRQAANGVSALLQLKQEVPDLVILDLRMPEMDGYEVLRHIRAEPAWMALPVVILSGHHQPQDLLRGLELGADEYLCKPVESWELKARVSSLLRVQTLRRRVIDLEREKVEAQMRLAGQVCLQMMNAAQELDGFLELELRAGPAPDRRAMLEPMAQRSRQLVTLLDALAEYSRLAPSAVETLDLRGVLELAAAACVADRQASGHRVDLELPADLPSVRGRKFELGLAFRELIDRAAGRMPQGGTVRVTGATAIGAVAIEVADTGAGLPEPEPLDVEPFAPQGASLPRKVALPVARSILADHAASIEVRAVPGTGTTVRVLLRS